MSSDESIQTNASFQSARSNDTAISTPDADDEPIQDPMEDVKTEPSVRSTAFGMDASMELMVDQMTRSSNNCGHSAEGGSMRGASGIMIDPTAGMTLQVPSSVSIDAVDSASQARMDINGHLVGIGGTGMMANSVIGI